jgi:SP family arabinose:H+ symporter-like MFS transporter
VALGTVGWMFQTGRGGLPLLVSILVFIAAFAMALGPIPWIISSEIFPTRIRGRAMSVATFTIWTSRTVARPLEAGICAPWPGWR